jgi:hypothetical protein
MTPNSRKTLKEWCLRQLGAPVLEINVADSQVEDAVDLALDYFKEYHGDGTQKTYLRHKVTGTVVTVSNASSYVKGEMASGSLGGMYTVFDVTSPTTLRLIPQGVASLQVNEVLTGRSSGTVGVATNVVLGDIDRGYLTVGPGVEAITKVFPLTTSIYGSGIFDIRYQMRLNDLFDLYSTEMTYYTNVMQHLSLIDFQLTVEKSFQFNRYTNLLTIDMNWKTAINPDEFIMVEAFVRTDPELFNAMYGDRLLRKLATAYIKKQWGMNMKKYNGVTILGGLTMNGQVIFEEANQEIKEIENEIRDAWTVPPPILIG